MAAKTARALASVGQQSGGAFLTELVDYVRTHVDPDARKVTQAREVLDAPPDASGRTWFDVCYE